MPIISEEQLKHRFSSNMRQLMATRAVSENELSKTTEISQSAINRIKNGQVCPSLYQAIAIAEALGNKLEDFIDISAEDIKESNYIAVISTSNLTEPDQTKVLGFIENDNDWKKNTVGFKVDRNFDCKILNNESIVIASIDSLSTYQDGDTVLFLFNKKYMIGTMHQGFIKPIDNLLLKIDVKNASMVGKVMNIETKYIKDKNTVVSILEKFNLGTLSNLISSLSQSLQSHPA
ncbi:TPA: helix-turn-helix transcriptional regulator [Legionella pneumophila]|uniref:helix-turn-helix domain-containing protein n=1 Tax=Legionella pneumophila TaxID=446 RepID=UPI000D0603CF|nr:helix-turn-helix transcriptional regulator [Legionella pneumophila]MCH9115356.1 helix-turn-helix transcriptional regulator [Legionella pneumophila serogroup 1]RYX04925.1 XRE family transcriptional regulator [Legionella pneumophila]HAT1821700.1 helix-turn-helix transcriptional regulator [Legionella pneumophila]HAU1134347.1 helix-turn-helix transcriptional regulator [Legionella pneumophila]HAU1180795.1 helix-turn-helix transcriptional regulator [Legionella pneumophila]